MFKVGEYIVHGRNGVCRVEDITQLDISGADKNQLYYILIPVKAPESKIFFPTDSDKVVMRLVVSKNEAKSIVEKIAEIKPLQIENEKLREALYKEAISSCDLMQLIGLIKALNERNRERMEQGKKATYVDDKYLKEAKDNLYDELSVALEREREEVEKFMEKYW